MAPCTKPGPLPVGELDEETKLVAPQAAPRKFRIIKTNILTFGYGHLAGLYGLYLCFAEAKWATVIMSSVLVAVASVGVTAGAHRLWTHRSYKAKAPLQVLLMVMNTFAFQNSAINWVRDHRLHHKYSDTDADPHNATRGFFYSHIGWLLVKKHPEVLKRGKSIDMSDIYANPVLTFQKKYAIPFIGTICFALPTLVPVYLWGESLWVAWHVALARYVGSLHLTFLVNSAAHMWGNKPFDSTIMPSENAFVSFMAFGEGWHNYHHVFPWDYKTAELGSDWINPTTSFIDFFARIGWAYDLKTVPEDVIRSRVKRTGDGTHKAQKKDDDHNLEEDGHILEDFNNADAKSFNRERDSGEDYNHKPEYNGYFIKNSHNVDPKAYNGRDIETHNSGDVNHKLDDNGYFKGDSHNVDAISCNLGGDIHSGGTEAKKNKMA